MPRFVSALISTVFIIEYQQNKQHMETRFPKTYIFNMANELSKKTGPEKRISIYARTDTRARGHFRPCENGK